MDGIDSHHLVCAWLNISPVAESGLSSASTPPSSADSSPSNNHHLLQKSSHDRFPHQRSKDDTDGGLFWGAVGGAGRQELPAISPLAVYPSAPESNPSAFPPDANDRSPVSETTPPAGLPVDSQSYRANLESVPTRKRQRASRSWSGLSTSTTAAAPTPSETRAKRRALEVLVPSTQFGTTHRPPTFPPHVCEFLRHFAASRFEVRCVPFSPEIKSKLDTSFPHEVFPVYAQLDVSDADKPNSLAFLEFATRIHSTCIRNSGKALDEAAWHPCVRSLLSVDPPCLPSALPALPPPEAHDPSPTELFLTIDATTKTTRKSVLPNNPNIKLDHLIVFNAEHVLLRPIAIGVRARALVINAFADTSIDDVPIALGVEVKAAGGSEGLIAAEFYMSVWAAKTLVLSSALAAVRQTATCDIAVGLSVCGHVWAMHVTYWSGVGALVTHGPVVIGSTDTLYGTMKIVAWVVRFKQWAAERLLPDWVERVGSS
ncbi:hypothetical protein Q9L58_007992 [Maublancomyces gigas]|uniref:PD-(D/E)XK nuclease-like domain-containing protein n=1 Tax=Discina gigas TaxID=1032678 RepID=A0ABR3GAX0_9PEZI